MTARTGLRVCYRGQRIAERLLETDRWPQHNPRSHTGRPPEMLGSHGRERHLVTPRQHSTDDSWSGIDVDEHASRFEHGKSFSHGHRSRRIEDRIELPGASVGGVISVVEYRVDASGLGLRRGGLATRARHLRASRQRQLYRERTGCPGACRQEASRSRSRCLTRSSSRLRT